MTTFSPTLPSPRLLKGRAPFATGPQACLNPNRVTMDVPREPAINEEEDLGPWVRLPGGELELELRD